MGQYEDLTAMINARKQQLRTASSGEKQILLQGISNLERQRDRTTPEKKSFFRPFGGKKRRTKRRKCKAGQRTRRRR
jgi:hypothetical protein